MPTKPRKKKPAARSSEVAKKPSSKTDREEQHPIGAAISALLRRCEDIRVAASVFVPLSGKVRQKQIEDLLEQLNKGEQLLRRKDSSAVMGIKKTHHAIQQLSHAANSELPDVVERSLFVGLFSAFDAFSGLLLSTIYKRKPQLFSTLQRTVSVSDILKHNSFNDLQNTVLRQELEDFRRQSYVDQFRELENTFSIKLREFKHWPDFVECSQRRNLVTHCDLLVTQQYLEICDREGFQFAKRPKVGQQLELGGKYFLRACDIVSEVGLKLGQTLWRKIFPTELKEADEELNEAIYGTLYIERYQLARLFAEFAISQKSLSAEVYRRMFTVNLAIALKAGGNTSDVDKVLKTLDWSACSLDFKLAEAVLRDRDSDACDLMKKIGKQAEYIKEESYHVWPLFSTFRLTPGFLKAYQEVYDRPFIVELQKEADKKKETLAESRVKFAPKPAKRKTITRTKIG